MKKITHYLANLKPPAFYEQFSPAHKKAALICLGIFVLILIYKAIDLGSGGDTKVVRKNARKEQTTVFTDKNTRQLGIEGLSSVVSGLEKSIDKQQAIINKLQEENQELKARRGQGENVPLQLNQLNQTLDSLKSSLKRQGWDIEDIKQDLNSPSGLSTPKIEPPKKVEVPVQADEGLARLNPKTGYYEPPGETYPGADVVAPVRSIDSQPLHNNGKPLPPPKIQIIEAKPKATNDSKVILNAGSIVTGVAINGVDVPSGEGSRKDPYPMLIRVQEDAILPNEYRADIKECFVNVSGYGELSSERYVARGENISCKTRDGKTIEEDFPAYLVGEDGKPGMRGVLVNRTGQLIANAALANTSKAIATAFSTSPVPVIETGNSPNKAYRNNFSADASRYAASQGLSGGLDALAEYWMKRADQILPVIEIEPGRQVTMHLQHHVVLSPKSIATLTKKNK